ncbi:MAG: hypothetical protein COC19_08695 [SAR86 cluster bacterium]|uniref:DUF2802 domain-containing protein n=1 Tax=SAR86 cluster bacterium TaxID=2030880 RepID=A0A2A4ME54_9GAMM|nr:MAG: hypothetical protein COC19_08695 [SAR86 cluster bacterium]
MLFDDFNSSMMVIVVVMSFTLITTALLMKLRRLEKTLAAFNAKFNGEVIAIGSGTAGMGKRLRSLEKKLNITCQKQDELKSREFAGFAYVQANKMLQMGAKTDQLVNDCGLSKAEVDLMKLMHTSRQAVKEVA